MIVRKKSNEFQKRRVRFDRASRLKVSSTSSTSATTVEQLVIEITKFAYFKLSVLPRHRVEHAEWKRRYSIKSVGARSRRRTDGSAGTVVRRVSSWSPQQKGDRKKKKRYGAYDGQNEF